MLCEIEDMRHLDSPVAKFPLPSSHRERLQPIERLGSPVQDLQTRKRIMGKQRFNQDNTAGMRYIKSLGKAVDRRFALEYLTWLRSGRAGGAPSRGSLSPAIWQRLCMNLEALG